jgi:hypothetical protein
MSVDLEPVDVPEGLEPNRVYGAPRTPKQRYVVPGSPAIELAKNGGIGSVRPADQ